MQRLKVQVIEFFSGQFYYLNQQGQEKDVIWRIEIEIFKIISNFTNSTYVVSIHYLLTTPRSPTL